MALTRVKLDRFTAFDKLDLDLSPGINVLVGANGTGKTHIMKVCYAACDVSKKETPFGEKLVNVFLPSGRTLGRLVRRRRGGGRAWVGVFREESRLEGSFSSRAQAGRSLGEKGTSLWKTTPIESVYIPVKEMLSNAPGFRSLYATREVHFDEVYADILDRAYLPQLRGRPDEWRQRLLDSIRQDVGGNVFIKNEEFFLRNRQGELEFSLLAEGMRKLALLWLLIQNGTLINGSVLFWDEPETNLNPKMYGALIKVLIELQRNGVQIFLATHDYVVLKEIDLQIASDDRVAFHSLYQDSETGEIAYHTTSSYLRIQPNAISEAFDSLYDREIERTIKGLDR
jgi:energy-coupling factor transporter ATP-binding protein EcfA2